MCLCGFISASVDTIDENKKNAIHLLLIHPQTVLYAGQGCDGSEDKPDNTGCKTRTIHLEGDSSTHTHTQSYTHLHMNFIFQWRAVHFSGVLSE